MKNIREAFEKVCAPNFVIVSEIDLSRNNRGEYNNPTFEDHWQTFQEGWECAIEYLKAKSNPAYSDIVSNGGMDPRP